MIQQAKLVVLEDKPQLFVRFEDNNVDMAYYKTRIETKLAIARFLGKPLATLPDVQLLVLDNLITESLHKVTLLTKVQEFFKLKLVANHR